MHEQPVVESRGLEIADVSLEDKRFDACVTEALIAAGVMPATKNGQFSGYQAPTCRSARNGKPLNTYGVQNGKCPLRSASER